VRIDEHEDLSRGDLGPAETGAGASLAVGVLYDFDFGGQGFQGFEFGFVDVPSYVGGEVVLARNAVVVDDDDFLEEFGRRAGENALDGDGDPFVGFVLGGHDDGDGGEHGFVEAVVAAEGVEEVFDAVAFVDVAVAAEVAEVGVGGALGGGEVGALEGVVWVAHEMPSGGWGWALEAVVVGDVVVVVVVVVVIVIRA